MAEWSIFGTRGAEISERSTELVLPGTPSPENRGPLRERKIGVSEPEATHGYEDNGQRAAVSDHTTKTTPASGAAPEATKPAEQRGIALPGDRGRESREALKQRPSFWRRIALGRRASKSRDDAQLMSQLTPTSQGTLTRSNPAQQSNADSIEKRIVEPLLQALGSVESKLERSHIDLAGRSDQVEKRLSQLWDIEEQLRTLGELQKSLLQVSEQQQRLESAVVNQNATLRWLVGAVFFSITVAALVVVVVLQ